MRLYVPLWDPSRHVFKMASLAVTCMPLSKRQGSGQVNGTVLPREAYYSSQVNRVSVASVQTEIRTLEANGTIE